MKQIYFGRYVSGKIYKERMMRMRLMTNSEQEPKGIERLYYLAGDIFWFIGYTFAPRARSYEEAVLQGLQGWPAFLPYPQALDMARIMYYFSLLSPIFKWSAVIHATWEIILFMAIFVGMILKWAGWSEIMLNNLFYCLLLICPSLNTLSIITEASLRAYRRIPQIRAQIRAQREESRRIRLEIERYSSILEGWRREGYNVSDLKKALDDMRSIFADEHVRHRVKDMFKEYESKISKLKALEAELNSLLSSARSIGLDFSDSISSIREMLRDPSKLDEVESIISALKDEVSIAQARLKVDEWRNRGYDVSELYELLMSRNISMVEKRLKEYEEAASNVKKLSERGFDVSGLERLLRKGKIDALKHNLTKFNKVAQEMGTLERDIQLLGDKRFAEEIQILKGRLGNLSNLEDVEEYVLRLKRRVEEAIRESKIEPWKRKLDEWLGMGYDLSWLKSDLAKYSVEIEKKLEKYERAIQEIQQLKKDLDMFKITTFNFEIFLIEKKMVKGEDIDRVLEEVSSIRQKAQDIIKVEMEKSIDGMILKVKKFLEELNTR
jgi:hypothetical protein